MSMPSSFSDIDLQTPAHRAGVATAAVVVGGGSWLAFRYYIRYRVASELNSKYHYDHLLSQVRSLGAVGASVQLPTAEEFAASLVPLFSPVMPKEAIEDILVKGRQSVYWPAAYRTGSVMALIEPYLLAGFRAAYYGDKHASPTQVASTILTGFVASAIEAGKR